MCAVSYTGETYLADLKIWQVYVRSIQKVDIEIWVMYLLLIGILFNALFFTAYRIHISNFTYLELVKIGGYMIEKRGLIPVKVSV